MYSYLDDAIREGLILESAIATPYNMEENIRRGRMAMQHVILTHGKEYHAMYREDLGWVAFSWGETGTPPPTFKNRNEAIQWWANLPGKTNAQKGSHVFVRGRGVSHIIAKRDWEAKWMDYFKNQSGVTVAMKCVEVIAKEHLKIVGTKREISFGKFLVSLIPDSRWVESRKERKNGKKKEEFWLLTGFEVVDDEKYGIFESADVAGGGSLPACSTHIMPLVSRHNVGAADSTEENLINSNQLVNNGWLYDL